MISFPQHLRAKNHHVVIGTQCVEAHNANQRTYSTCPNCNGWTSGLPSTKRLKLRPSTGDFDSGEGPEEISNWQNIMTDQPISPRMHPPPPEILV